MTVLYPDRHIVFGYMMFVGYHNSKKILGAYPLLNHAGIRIITESKPKITMIDKDGRGLYTIEVIIK